MICAKSNSCKIQALGFITPLVQNHPEQPICMGILFHIPKIKTKLQVLKALRST
jgi:hypothetical protein